MRRDLTKTATVLQRFGVCVYIYVIYTESLAGGGGVRGYCKGSRARANLQVWGPADLAHLDWAPVFLNLYI